MEKVKIYNDHKVLYVKTNLILPEKNRTLLIHIAEAKLINATCYLFSKYIMTIKSNDESKTIIVCSSLSNSS